MRNKIIALLLLLPVLALAAVTVTHPSGEVNVFASGSTVTVSGIFGGTPTGGTLSLGNITMTLGTVQGGTGQSSYAVGDILYASTTTALSKLAGVATGNALISGGVSTAPSWGKVALTTHVSGVLPYANGGTAVTALPKFIARMSGNQVIADSTYTKIIFDTEERDTNANYDPATNYRFTPTIAGDYWIVLNVRFAANANSTVLYIYKNGAVLKTIAQRSAHGLDNISGSLLVNMNGSTDYLEAFCLQNSGGNLTITGDANISFFCGALAP